MLAVTEGTTTAMLAREMIRLELAAKEAAAQFEFLDYASEIWRQRDEVRHQRSLLLRQVWHERAERLWGPL